MVQMGFTKPNNDVVQGQDNGFVEYLFIKTVAECYPGRLVSRDTTDAQIKACTGGADAPIGWLGYGLAFASHKPTDRDTIYVVGSSAPVHNGAGFRVRATLLANAAAIVKGDYLVSTTAGCVKKAAAATVTVATGGSGTGDSGALNVAGSVGSDGPIVAQAMETVNNSANGAIAPIWVKSFI